MLNILKNRRNYIHLSYVLIFALAIFVTYLQYNSAERLNRLNKNIKKININYICSLELNEANGKIIKQIEEVLASNQMETLLIANDHLKLEDLYSELKRENISLVLEIILALLDGYEETVSRSLNVLITSIISIIIVIILLAIISEMDIYKQTISEKIKSEADQHLIQILEHEKNFLAIELHDDVAQKLSIIKQHLSKTNSDGIFERYTSDVISKIRSIAHDLRSPEFKDEQFLEIVLKMCSDFRSLTTINLVTNFLGLGQLELLNIKKLHIYRIIQELLSNGLKHSKAENINLDIVYAHPSLKITYKDDGIGYTEGNNRLGLGLRSIDYRVNILNANKADLESVRGIRVKIEVPIDE